jgi:hypothetical protein
MGGRIWNGDEFEKKDWGTNSERFSGDRFIQGPNSETIKEGRIEGDVIGDESGVSLIK